MNRVIVGDCIDEMKILPEGSVDSVVTDPPYGLGFMGKGWDIHTPLDFERFTEAWATECLRVLKPGGHLLAFGGSRTWHRLAAGIEDAGFELRDSIAWLYGTGFPKSMDVSKAIDKAAGATREVVGVNPRAAQQTPKHDDTSLGKFAGTSADLTAPATDAAREWEGWGTALKPAFEPIVVARKPLGEKTVATNVLKYGTGALNIDATRIGTDEDRRRNARGGDNGLNGEGTFRIRERRAEDAPLTSGRWPANVVLDESQAAALDAQSGTLKTGGNVRKRNADTSRDAYSKFNGQSDMSPTRAGDSGGASRFFFVARGEGATMEPCPTESLDEFANTAEQLSTPQSQAAASARDDAVISARRDTSPDESSGPSTKGTRKKSKKRAMPAMPTTPSTAEKSSHEPPPARLTPSGNPVPSAATQASGTTRIMGAPLTSSGTADRTISDDTLSFMGLGDQDSRFIYNAKAPKSERPIVDGVAHPTVKPLALMRWLIRLVTPPGGMVLDPFAGSGTTIEAAIMDGFDVTGIENEVSYIPLINARIARSMHGPA